jgi:hypothetical protein
MDNSARQSRDLRRGEGHLVPFSQPCVARHSLSEERVHATECVDSATEMSSVMDEWISFTAAREDLEEYLTSSMGGLTLFF